MGKVSKALGSLATAAVTGLAAVSPAKAQLMDQSAVDFHRVTLQLFAYQEYKKTPTPEPFSLFLRGAFAQVASQSLEDRQAFQAEIPDLLSSRLDLRKCQEKWGKFDQAMDRFHLVQAYDQAAEAGIYAKPVLYTDEQAATGKNVFRRYETALNRACMGAAP